MISSLLKKLGDLGTHGRCGVLKLHRRVPGHFLFTCSRTFTVGCIVISHNA